LEKEINANLLHFSHTEEPPEEKTGSGGYRFVSQKNVLYFRIKLPLGYPIPIFFL
jgi:hypothetical protein